MDLKKTLLPETAFVRTIMFCPTPKTFQMAHCHFIHFISTSNAHIWYFFILFDFILGGIQFFYQISRGYMMISVRQFPDLQDVSLILVVLRESIYLALLIYGLSVQQLLSYGKGWELLVLKYLGCFLN
jgi:hypothetical protein